MDMPKRMKFGCFMGPFHRVGENPTLALDRDLELIDWMDNLGFDEAWIGEHHSAGWEIIASPEVFIAAAAQRTRYIKLGTGVVSLPYHHPLMVADRMVQLDHMTHGRVLRGWAGRPARRRLHDGNLSRDTTGAHGRCSRNNYAALHRDRTHYL
jgi:limonene 1,2-monooxygenase